MQKLWMGFLLLVTSIGVAASSGAQETTTLTKLYQVRIQPPSQIDNFTLSSQKPYLAIVHRGQSKGSWTISAWRAESSIPVYRETLRGYVANEPAPVVRFSPDDSWLAIGVQTQVRLVDTSSWKFVADLALPAVLAPVCRVNGLAFTSDSKQLVVRYMVPAAPTEQQPAAPYDLETKQPLRTHILTGPVDYLTVGETDGPWFATVERDVRLRPWLVLRVYAHAPAEINRWQLTSPANPLLPDREPWWKFHFCQGPEECSQIVGLSTSGGNIRCVFLNSTGQALGVWEARSGGFENLLAKSSGGRMLAAVATRVPRAAALLPASPSAAEKASAPVLAIFDLQSGKEIYRKELVAGRSKQASWQALALSEDGKLLAVQDGARSVTVYTFTP